MKNFIIHSNTEKVRAFNKIAELPEDSTYQIIIKKIVHKRTTKQNSSLHKYLSLMSASLNEAGQSQKMLMDKFKGNFSLPVTEVFLKDIFREAGHAMFGVESTSDLSTVQMQETYKAFDLRIAEMTGVSLPWPSSEPPPY